ncbi:cyclic nucleotide-binding protein [Candidatus Magnetoovum chiemensis]|nr:cyclic nucleotide-binding protein [Candidatus Magnetoovum chiemensis]
MAEIVKTKVSAGIYYVEIPSVKVFILCGCPADAVKHLIKKGLIKTVEKNGVTFETGPNVILLSDVLVQRGNFSNLSEFLVLQMLYRQGIIIPGHPNNTGIKPVLIGNEEQVHAQMHYIYCGNYGLTTIEEMKNTGIDDETAYNILRLKKKFAFGSIKETEELLGYKIINDKKVEIRDGVYINRKGFNIFEISYNSETIEVDLNLNKNEEYEPPYELGFHNLQREYFSITHTGDGDGWDTNRPCTMTILIFQGRIYLIDAGPNVQYSLTALGVSVNEIEGIFHTHAHDDHFAGLTTLIRADHKIKYYSTPLVRASVSKKLSALMSWNEDQFQNYFDIHDLAFNKWNYVEGLEVKPFFSPHPIETNIFTFRALWEKGYLTYSHFVDISSLDVLKNMITDDHNEAGISRDFYETIKRTYLTPANYKKIDIGGGFVHGSAEDFKNDTSDNIILAHTSYKLTVSQKAIGSDSAFGSVNVIIHANQDYTLRDTAQLLKQYYPKAPMEDIRMILNCNIVFFNAGAFLIKQGTTDNHIYLILSGIVEVLRVKEDYSNILTAGSLVGELSGIDALKAPSMETYRAASYVRALEIPSVLYSEFVKRNDLYAKIGRIIKNREFLYNTWLFGDMVSYPIQNKIAQFMTFERFDNDSVFTYGDKAELYLISQGAVRLSSCSKHKCGDKAAARNVIETLTAGDFFGEETIIHKSGNLYDAKIDKNSTIYKIPGEKLADIPVVIWKLLETSEKRCKLLKAL